jgi:phenylalanine ammonia-lyase
MPTFSRVQLSSLALISARATINALEVLSMLTSSYLYLLCQAFDIRALQAEFNRKLITIVEEELSAHFGRSLPRHESASIFRDILKGMYRTLDSTTTMDAAPRMTKVASASVSVLVDFFTTSPSADLSALSAIPAFRVSVASRATSLLVTLRQEYLSGARGPAPASKYLNKTRPIYDFVRKTLGIRMHGSENESVFSNGLGVEDVTIGQNVSLIHEVRVRDVETVNEYLRRHSDRQFATEKCKPPSRVSLHSSSVNILILQRSAVHRFRIPYPHFVSFRIYAYPSF